MATEKKKVRIGIVGTGGVRASISWRKYRKHSLVTKSPCSAIKR